MGREEDEYNSGHAKRLEKSVFIYEDKKVEEMTNQLKRIENKVNLLIRMLTAHDYDSKKQKKDFTNNNDYIRPGRVLIPKKKSIDIKVEEK